MIPNGRSRLSSIRNQTPLKQEEGQRGGVSMLLRVNGVI